MSLGLHQYLLLDGAQIDDLLPRLYQLQETPVFHRLYQNTRYAALADSGPILVQLQPDGPLQQHFVEHWQAHAGLWLQSDAGDSEVLEHLRSLVHARVRGVSVLLRYYDPRIMRHWLAELPANERDRLMGPVTSLRLPATPAGDTALVVQRQSPAPAARYDDTPWLSLDDDQVERLNRAQLEAFDQHLLAHIERQLPDSLAGLDATARQTWAAQCRQGAAAHGYGSAEQAAQWANLCAVLGVDFPQGQDQQPYRQILDSPQLRPEQRLERLASELQCQLLNDKDASQ